MITFEIIPDLNMTRQDLILYVDDEMTNLELFELSFRRDFNIITCNSPFDALEILREHNIKVLITDYKMPRMNGMELIQAIKKEKPQLVCMILSAYLESEVVTDSKLLYRYIMKPWDRKLFRELIQKALEN
jgi:DNA-binding NtrC family response regulator